VVIMRELQRPRFKIPGEARRAAKILFLGRISVNADRFLALAPRPLLARAVWHAPMLPEQDIQRIVAFDANNRRSQKFETT
jgi:hypothetical protein